MPLTLKHSQNLIHALIHLKFFDRTFIRELYTSIRKKKDPQTFLIVHLPLS